MKRNRARRILTNDMRICLTEQQKELFIACAKGASLSLSEWGREALQLVAELSPGKVKHLCQALDIAENGG